MSYLTAYYAQSPTPGQEFGASRDGGSRHHEGADFSHSRSPGTIDVPAVVGGQVTGNYWTDGYGWRLVIGPWSYSHLNTRSPLPVGAWVDAGDIVGQEGETGWTSGPCCHVEYMAGGRKVDPVPIIRSTLAAAPASVTARPLHQEEEEDMATRIAFYDGGAGGGDDLLVVDHGAKTFWNAAEGMDSVANAYARVQNLRDQGIPMLAGRQPRKWITNYNDITGQGVIDKALVEGLHSLVLAEQG
jgi:hypothetical protein